MQQGFDAISPGKLCTCVILSALLVYILYVCMSLPNSHTPVGACLHEPTLSVTAVRIMAWVMRESPYISRSAFERFFTETPNTSSWLNLHTDETKYTFQYTEFSAG